MLTSTGVYGITQPRMQMRESGRCFAEAIIKRDKINVISQKERFSPKISSSEIFNHNFLFHLKHEFTAPHPSYILSQPLNKGRRSTTCLPASLYPRQCSKCEKLFTKYIVEGS